MSSLTGRLFGHYRILERVGKGGMATVYRADDRKSGLDVAIKFMSPALAENENFLTRFRREVKLVARLDHPNIVPVFDYGEQEGFAYVVMPLLQRGSLTDRMKQGAISLDEGGKLLDQVSGALDYAHRRGIVHRDVKPSNILLDSEGNALLGDFGLARYDEVTVSLTGSALIGTPAYIAPEQVRGERVDARCDQYSLGVILFQLATGTLPFDATSPMAMALKHISEPFPLARSRSPTVPESVERVILRATAKTPAERFVSVGEMNEALQAALAYLRDPSSHRAPTIELPRAAAPAAAGPVPGGPPRKVRTVRIAAISGAILLMVLAAPVFASGLLGLLERASSPAGGGLGDPGPPSAAELTAQAAMFEAMSTQLAGEAGVAPQPGEIETAVIQTLTAAGRFGPTAANGFGTPGVESGAVLESSGSPAAGSLTPNPTPTPTQAPGSTAAPNPPPTATSVPSRTPVTPGPSSTASRTPTPSPTASRTPTATRSPTPSWTPSSTPTPAPTLVPPASPTEDPCASVTLGGIVVDGNTASAEMSNTSSTMVQITRIVLGWPAANVALAQIEFGEHDILKDPDASPPTDTNSEGGLKGNRNLGAPQQSPKSLSFVFSSDALPAPYSLQVELDAGCQLSAGG